MGNLENKNKTNVVEAGQVGVSVSNRLSKFFTIFLLPCTGAFFKQSGQAIKNLAVLPIRKSQIILA
jgi:hypothetical protein